MLKKYSQLLIGLFNQFFNMVTPFIITIIGLKYISVDKGSIWIIFLSMMVLISLFDFGLSPTTIRNISYVIGGAKKLTKDGISNFEHDSKISYPLLSRLLKDVKNIYAYITFFAFFIIAIGGGGYFFLISPSGMKCEILVAWLIYSTGLLLNLYYLYYTPVLCGVGVIQHAYYSNIAGRISWLIATIIVALYWPGLIGFSLAFVFSVLINRLVISHYYNRNSYIIEAKKFTAQDESTIPYIAHNTVKLGTVSIGSFMISRATVLIAAAFLPLAIAGEYTFTLQVYMALLAVGNVYISIKIPDLSRFVMRGDIINSRELIIKILSVSAGIYLSGFLFFYFLSDYIIKVFHAKVGFLPDKYLLILGGVYFLELLHSLCATILTTKNKIPFVKPALISGVLIVISSYALLKYTSLGLVAVIVAQGSVQLMYNNWKWPLVVYREFFTHDKYKT
ncbi:hypothetical protein D8682_24055 [Buttiauxella sp. 3AFRM03]|nr:hypothetical protein D8682_24055 [Buttiauxella sp. 3AFRM03]